VLYKSTIHTDIDIDNDENNSILNWKNLATPLVKILEKSLKKN